MRSVFIRRAIRDKQQNQTSITTNIDYIQNFMSIEKRNLLTSSKYRRIKLKLNKATCNSLEKIWITL